jgi:hypothetical protein
MNNSLIVKGVCICVFGSILHSLCAKDMFIRSREKLFQQLGKTALSVVLFYAEDKEQAKDKEYKNQIRELEQVLRDVGRVSIYKEVDMLFVRVNVSTGKTEGLHQEYGIKQLPACILFKDGSPVYTPQGSVVGLYGFSANTRADLKKIIDAYFTQDIQRILQNKAIIRQRQLEEARINALYWGPYWAGCGPYGWGPGDYGYGYPSGMSFGFSVGL